MIFYQSFLEERKKTLKEENPEKAKKE